VSKYLLFNLDNNYELRLANKLGVDLLPDCKIVGRMTDQLKTDPRKKIAMVHWWCGFGGDLAPVDLSWADLIVCYTGELINGPWEEYYQKTIAKFNNTNFISVSNGVANMNSYPEDIVFDQLGHFFSKIVDRCYYEEWQISQPKSKIFDALLGIAKPHRVFILSNLTKHNLLDKSFVNIWSKPGKPGYPMTDINYTSPELIEVNDPAIQKNKDIIDQWSTMICINGLKNGISMSHSIPTEIYRQSWYSIVAETGTSDSLFLTEKTAKPIFEKRLFVMFGSMGLLKRLHSQGYQTFGGVIDESYDDEPDDYKRWTMAFDQVIKLSNSEPTLIYQQINPILEHNHATICNQATRLRLLSGFLNKHICRLDTY
jgi:hypothetical protein